MVDAGHIDTILLHIREIERQTTKSENALTDTLPGNITIISKMSFLHAFLSTGVCFKLRH